MNLSSFLERQVPKFSTYYIHRGTCKWLFPPRTLPSPSSPDMTFLLRNIHFDAWTLCSQGAKWCWIHYRACMLENMRIHRELMDEEEYSVALDKGFVLWRAGLCPSLSWRSLSWRSLTILAAEAVVPRYPSARGLFEA